MKYALVASTLGLAAALAFSPLAHAADAAAGAVATAASGATAAKTVRARSAAEMPVDTPSAASMLTVKLVWNCAVLACTIGARPRDRKSVV